MDGVVGWSLAVPMAAERNRVACDGDEDDDGDGVTAMMTPFNTCLLCCQGAVLVKVETRDSASASYGQGSKQPISFGNFIEAMRAGDGFVVCVLNRR